MPQFIDLNLANAELRTEATRMGFDALLSPMVVYISKPTKLTAPCVVEGGSEEALVSTCKASKPFLLVNPLLINNFHKSRALVEIVREKGKCFEIPLFSLLNASYVQRAKLLNNLRAFLKLCLKRKAPFLLTTRAKTPFDVKSPREFIAIGVALGLSQLQAQYAISAQPRAFMGELR